MFLRTEIGRHAALAAITAAERHADQIAGEVIGPLVIGADELLRRTAAGSADLHAAMRAAIDQHVDRAVAAADRDHVAIAKLAALEVAGIGDLGLEADIQPVARAEDAVQFAREDLRIGIDPVRHARRSAVRPFANNGSRQRVHRDPPFSDQRQDAPFTHTRQRHMRRLGRWGESRMGMLVRGGSADLIDRHHAEDQVEIGAIRSERVVAGRAERCNRPLAAACQHPGASIAARSDGDSLPGAGRRRHEGC